MEFEIHASILNLLNKLLLLVEVCLLIQRFYSMLMPIWGLTGAGLRALKAQRFFFVRFLYFKKAMGCQGG